MTKPDLIIFDCDGVLVDSEVLSCRCLSQVLARYGIDLDLEQALELFLGRSVTAIRDHYQALGHPLPEQFTAELSAAVRAAFLAALCPIEGVSSVLRSLRIPHCVASSSDIDRVSILAFPDRSGAVFRTAALYLADGGTRQAGARSVPLRGRADAGGAAS